MVLVGRVSVEGVEGLDAGSLLPDFPELLGSEETAGLGLSDGAEPGAEVSHAFVFGIPHNLNFGVTINPITYKGFDRTSTDVQLSWRSNY